MFNFLSKIQSKFLFRSKKEHNIYSESMVSKPVISLLHNLEITSLFSFNNQKNLESPSLMIYKASLKSLVSIYTRIFAVLFYVFFSLNGLLCQDFLNSFVYHSLLMSQLVLDTIESFEIIFGILHVLSVVVHSYIGESHH